MQRACGAVTRALLPDCKRATTGRDRVGAGAPMQFSILGPLHVTADGHEVPLGGVRPRALLAMLILHANEPVSAERLAVALWGDDAPAGSTKTVQVNVSRLRKALGDPEVLTTRLRLAHRPAHEYGHQGDHRRRRADRRRRRARRDVGEHRGGHRPAHRPAAGAVAATIRTGHLPSGLALTEGRLWVTVRRQP